MIPGFVKRAGAAFKRKVPFILMIVQPHPNLPGYGTGHQGDFETAAFTSTVNITKKDKESYLDFLYLDIYQGDASSWAGDVEDSLDSVVSYNSVDGNLAASTLPPVEKIHEIQANADSGHPVDKTTNSTNEQQSCLSGEIESFSLWSQHSSANNSNGPATVAQHELRVKDIMDATGSSNSEASSPTLCRAELASSIMEEEAEEYRLLSTLPKETQSTWMKLMIADIRQRLERLENILCTYNAVLNSSGDSPCSATSSISGTLVSSVIRPSPSIRDDYEDDTEELAACLEALKDMKKRVDHSREQSKRALEERKKEREAILSRCL